MIVRYRLALVLVFAVGALLPARAEAESYSFTDCFGSNSGLCSALAPQLEVEVISVGNFADVTFTTDIGIASSITDIYFDADGLLADMKIQAERSGVDFESGTNPPRPPGGNQALPVSAPEPAMMALFGIGLFAVAARARRRKSRAQPGASP